MATRVTAAVLNWVASVMLNNYIQNVMIDKLYV